MYGIHDLYLYCLPKSVLFSDGNPFEQLEPCLWCRINSKGLWFFLLSNILTGMVNFSLPTIDLEDSLATLLLIGYSFVLAVIPFVTG